MFNCDLCNTTIGPGASRFSPSQMRSSIAAGLEPPEHIISTGVAFGAPRSAVVEGWRQQAVASPTDWAMCPDCAEEVERHSGVGASYSAPSIASCSSAGSTYVSTPSYSSSTTSSYCPSKPALPDDVKQGRPLAILGYLVWMLALIPLLTRDNRFALFHAKQALALYACNLLMLPLLLVSAVMLEVHEGLGLLMMLPILPLSLALSVMYIVGLVHAAQGKDSPLPVVGRLVRLLDGIKVKEAVGD